MIGFLEGKVISKNCESSQCVLLCQNIGYEIYVSRRVFEQLQNGMNVSLWVQTVVREESFSLYGFLLEVEKHFFKLLLTVSGLGPKTALSLLSEHGSETLFELILQKDLAQISRAPGVGKKLAERLSLELKSRLEKWSFSGELNQGVKKSSDGSRANHFYNDLSSALQHLGYPSPLVKGTIEKLSGEIGLEEMGFELALKRSLSEISKHSARKVLDLGGMSGG